MLSISYARGLDLRLAHLGIRYDRFGEFVEGISRKSSSTPSSSPRSEAVP